MSNRVKTAITANPKTDILKDVVIPTLSNETEVLGTCENSNFFFYTSKALKIIDIYNKREEHLAAWTFPLNWLAANEKINACQYLGQNFDSKEYKTTSCFVLDRISKIDSRYFPGDTIPITVGAFTNHKYYPYFSEVVQDLDFTWLTLTGVFEPDGKINPAGKTNSQGKATVKWVLPCKEEKASVTVSLPGLEYSLYQDIFTTTTKVPGLKIEKTGDNQEGEKGKVLSNPIKFIIKDLSDNWWTNQNRFNIKWEVYEDGEWQIAGNDVIQDDTPFDPNKHFYASKNWKLADVDGEQKLRATIKDKCGKNWNIEGNPVVFTANYTYKLKGMWKMYIWSRKEVISNDLTNPWILLIDFQNGSPDKALLISYQSDYDFADTKYYVPEYITFDSKELVRLNGSNGGSYTFRIDKNNPNLLFGASDDEVERKRFQLVKQ